MKIAIVGSGPSAAAALEQVSRVPNLEVHHIDTGLVSGEGMELEQYESVNITKSYLGSDHPYRRFLFASKVSQHSTYVPRSFAFGGLSLVWGATMLPYIEEDCADWAITPVQLDDFYRHIAGYVWISGDTSPPNGNVYPDYVTVGYLPPSKRFQSILRNKYSSELGASPSRVAIHATTKVESGCVLCGECLQGCKYGQIWNSADFINQRSSDEVIKVRGYVETLSLKDGKILISTIDHDGAKVVLKDFDKVFLGTGVLETFRILSRSNFVDSKRQLSDSSIAYVPFFSLFRFSKSRALGHSLTKLVFRLNHDLPGRRAHLQLYNISPEMEKEIAQRYPFLEFIPEGLRKFALSFFAVGILYLPSELSPKIDIKLESNGDVTCTLSEELVSDMQRINYSHRVLRLNYLSFLKTGIVPLGFATVTKVAGSGVHTGSTFPMGSATDRLGQLYSVPNIHILDASILPDIPAGPITYTVMANASRICVEAMQ